MAKLIVLFTILFPCFVFAQGNSTSGDGGPSIRANSQREGSLGVNRDSVFGISISGDGGPAASTGIIPVSNTGQFGTDFWSAGSNDTKPTDLAAAIELYTNRNVSAGEVLGVKPRVNLRPSNQRFNAGSVLSNLVDAGTTRERAPHYRTRENRALRIVEVGSYQDISDIDSADGLFDDEAIVLDTDAAFNTFGGEALGYRNIGKVLDIETKDQGVMDRETLLDTKPKWLRERSGNLWVKKDAPIVNYQNESGEVFEFKFESPSKENETEIAFEFPGSDD